jgi:hypothetical protein
MESAVKTNYRFCWGLFLLSCIIFVVTAAESVADNTEPVKTVSILPFETNSQSDLSYAIDGILSMLHTRLFWKDKVSTVKQGITNSILAREPVTGEQDIYNIARKTQSDYVVTGVVTNFSGAFSIDSKVYNLKDNTVLTFFGQSKTIDGLISSVDIVAAKINKKVFDRTTASYEKFKRDKIITEEELRRMNPEKMMPRQRILQDEEKPWWKIW